MKCLLARTNTTPLSTRNILRVVKNGCLRRRSFRRRTTVVARPYTAKARSRNTKKTGRASTTSVRCANAYRNMCRSSQWCSFASDMKLIFVRRSQSTPPRQGEWLTRLKAHTQHFLPPESQMGSVWWDLSCLLHSLWFYKAESRYFVC